MFGKFCGVITALLLISSPFSAQDGSEILLSINNDPITKSEFESIYKKNNKDKDVTKADLEEYLELFINFKLKVKEAESLGMDTLDKFKRELQGYRLQLASPYLVDSELSDKLLEEAYERLKTEVKASHILITLPASPAPEDTLAAWKKIMDIRKKLEKGSDFDEMAKKFSEDPSAKTNGGDLGYFTALQMVYPFENAAYNTPVNEIAGPVKTRFGYHLIKVKDKREARGEMRVAHIMVKTVDEDPDEVKVAAEKKIRELYDKLNNGASFEELASKFSDDRTSGARGGELPPFGTNRMVPEFEEAAFALENDGEISVPVKTQYGWHIIKRLEYITLKPYDLMLPELKAKVGKDSRSRLTKSSFIAKMKKEYGYKEFSDGLKEMKSLVDTNIFNAGWTVPESFKDKPIFTIGDKTFNKSDFAQYLERSQRKTTNRPSMDVFLQNKFEDFSEEAIKDYENSRLEIKYPEFRSLIQEYHDGILLFDLTDQLVWSKAVKDTVGLQQYFEDHKEEYRWKERAAVDIYTCPRKEDAVKVRKLLKKKKNLEEIRKEINQESQLNVNVESGLFEKGEREMIDNLTWEKGVSDVNAFNDQFVVVHFKDVLPEAPKSLKEIRGVVTAAYQNQLEQDWIRQLREKYEVKVNEEVLYSIQ